MYSMCGKMSVLPSSFLHPTLARLWGTVPPPHELVVEIFHDCGYCTSTTQWRPPLHLSKRIKDSQSAHRNPDTEEGRPSRSCRRKSASRTARRRPRRACRTSHPSRRLHKFRRRLSTVGLNSNASAKAGERELGQGDGLGSPVRLLNRCHLR